MASITEDAPMARGKIKGPLIFRQSIFTRVTHWVWAIAMFFLLLSGLNIFNARPQLYIGMESGFEYDNTVMQIGAEQTADGQRRGYLSLDNPFGGEPIKFDTTGVLGLSGTEARPDVRAFPRWATIPSYYDLGTARVVHFFFGWIFVGAIFVWFAASLINGHLRRDLVPTGKDITGLPKDIADHATLRFTHGRTYSPLQKFAYIAVFLVLFPAIILTGLSMSPTMNAAWPWLLDIFGGRQTARTIHFIAMALLVLFFIVHIAMVLLAGPFNELRSMITGWYRASPGTPLQPGDKP
jgi:thiosulfate reductase cytochrome b subunit